MLRLLAAFWAAFQLRGYLRERISFSEDDPAYSEGPLFGSDYAASASCLSLRSITSLSGKMQAIVLFITGAASATMETFNAFRSHCRWGRLARGSFSAQRSAWLTRSARGLLPGLLPTALSLAHDDVFEVEDAGSAIPGHSGTQAPTWA
mmetsp:Transcript_22805/g.50411  ORF Transcript_22805/g.50411 Transcript_22805/m.50411 type:complete len:149 (-) Transcript_22805:334-780(-)